MNYSFTDQLFRIKNFARKSFHFQSFLGSELSERKAKTWWRFEMVYRAGNTLAYLDIQTEGDHGFRFREGFKKSKWKFKMAFAMKGGGLEGVSSAIYLF